MAKYISEDQQSRSIDMNNGGGSSTRNYTMRDYTEADDAYRALREYAPETIYIYGFLLSRTGIKVNPDFSDPQATLYRGVVSYKSETMEGSSTNSSGGGGGGGGGSDLPKNAEVGKGQDPKKEKIDADETSKVWFTFGTRTTTILQNLGDTRRTSGADKKWQEDQKSDKYGFINKDADDVAPAGVEVQEGSMFMHLQVVLKPSTVNPAFYRAAREAMMSVNLNKFAYAFASGTIQFQGIDIEEMVKGDFKVVYHFEYRPMTTTRFFTVDLDGTFRKLTGIRAGKPNLSFTGFDYTWLSYQDIKVKTVEGDDEAVTYDRSVDSVNLAQIYPRIAFGDNLCLKHCKRPEGDKNQWSL